MGVVVSSRLCGHSVFSSPGRRWWCLCSRPASIPSCERRRRPAPATTNPACRPSPPPVLRRRRAPDPPPRRPRSSSSARTQLPTYNPRSGDRRRGRETLWLDRPSVRPSAAAGRNNSGWTMTSGAAAAADDVRAVSGKDDRWQSRRRRSWCGLTRHGDAAAPARSWWGQRCSSRGRAIAAIERSQWNERSAGRRVVHQQADRD